MLKPSCTTLETASLQKARWLARAEETDRRTLSRSRRSCSSASATTNLSRAPKSRISCSPFSMRYRRRFRSTINRSEEHTSELQSRLHLVCRLLLEKKKKTKKKKNK